MSNPQPYFPWDALIVGMLAGLLLLVAGAAFIYWNW